MSKQVIYDNGYKFTVDDNGTITAEGTVPTQGVECGKRVTPDGMQPGDQRGHVIAAQEGGPNKSYNMTAQDGKLNQGAYKTAENSESALAKQGYTVQTSKTAFVSNQEGNRPDAYMINDTITSPDGKTQSVHLSFQNMSPEEQAECNQYFQENDFTIDPNPDAFRESMTSEEYSALMEETENDLPSIKDEFDMDSWSETRFDSESTQQGEETLSGVEEGPQGGGTSADAGTDPGADAGASAGCDIEM